MKRSKKTPNTEIVSLVRRAQFSASHRMHNSEWSAARNKAVFGKCNHAAGHGHNYILEVEIRGPVNPESGMVYNMTDLKRAIEAQVMGPMDHKNLNVDVLEFKTRIPTAENIAIVIWQRLNRSLPPGLLYEVRLKETENNFAAYRGPSFQ